MVDTTDRPRDIAAIPQTLPAELRRPLDQMRQNLQILLGQRGSGEWAAFTERRAAQLGLSNVGTGTDSGGAPGAGDADLTPPPSVTGLALSAGISFVMVEWDAAVYAQGHGHGRTNLYAVQRNPTDASVPTFLDAVLVYSAIGAMRLAAIPSEPNMRWHVWATWVSVDGVESVSPAGGTNGMTATTGADVSHLLDVLQGEITASELFAGLSGRIDLIDAPGTVPGSVNERLAVESVARSTADGQLGAQYTVKVDLNGYVSGFGLASTTAGAAPSSSFIVRANSFAVASPSGPGIAPIVPFVVNTTAVLENGVAVPAGVYMDGAYIRNLTAAIARMGNAWIDDAKIANLSAAKITAGVLDAARIAVGSIDARIANITDGQIVSLNAAKIIAGTLSAGQIASGTLDAARIGAGSLSADKIAAGSITTDRFQSNAVSSNNSVVLATYYIRQGLPVHPDASSFTGYVPLGTKTIENGQSALEVRFSGRCWADVALFSGSSRVNFDGYVKLACSIEILNNSGTVIATGGGNDITLRFANSATYHGELNFPVNDQASAIGILTTGQSYVMRLAVTARIVDTNGLPVVTQNNFHVSGKGFITEKKV